MSKRKIEFCQELDASDLGKRIDYLMVFLSPTVGKTRGFKKEINNGINNGVRSCNQTVSLGCLIFV